MFGCSPKDEGRMGVLKSLIGTQAGSDDDVTTNTFLKEGRVLQNHQPPYSPGLWKHVFGIFHASLALQLEYRKHLEHEGGAVLKFLDLMVIKYFRAKMSVPLFLSIS